MKANTTDENIQRCVSAIHEAERNYYRTQYELLSTLVDFVGKAKAADLLNIERKSIYNKLKRYERNAQIS